MAVVALYVTAVHLEYMVRDIVERHIVDILNPNILN